MEDIPHAVEVVKSLGGALVGEVVTTPVGIDKSISWCYMTDPEGNIVELQTAIR